MLRSRRLRLWLLGMSIIAAATPVGAVAQTDDRLTKLVIVSRHGVRTPLPASSELALWAAQPWPGWREGRGDLTAHGKLLATLMGRYYRAYLSSQDLLDRDGCPTPESVHVYADVAERTKMTALGLIEGFAPGCKLDYRSQNGVVDPLFHPLEGEVCKLDALAAQTAVLARVNGNFTDIVNRQRAQFAALQSTMNGPNPALCAASGLAPGCKLADIPTALVTAPDGKSVRLAGALSIASTATEIFLLEYANAKPMAEVAWGRADVSKIGAMLALHDAEFDLTERTPYLARRSGSSLLARVAAVITGQTVGGVSAEPTERAAKVVAYVGHDTNLANLGGMLDASWALPGWLVNETPPAGAMLFELREARDRQQRIYVSYISQTADQMRSASRLTLDGPPVRAPIRIPACSTNERGYPCPLGDFVKAVSAALIPECVAKP
jgi:4-phytase/acid phosphatase